MAPEDNQRLVNTVLRASDSTTGDRLSFRTERRTDDTTKTESDVDVSLLASGGYNDVWLAKVRGFDGAITAKVPFGLLLVIAYVLNQLYKLVTWLFRRQFQRKVTQQITWNVIVRVPNEESLKPYQIRNEVGWLKYISMNHPDIPVPRVYAYCDGEDKDRPPYIIEEYLDGESLSDAWKQYSEQDKERVAKQVARLVVRLGEIRFDRIGGMTPAGELGPTVEGIKLFKGRDTFHKQECYDIGPYGTTTDYISAMYDKEIYFYTHADEDCFEGYSFDTIGRKDFLQNLKDKRQHVLKDLAEHPRKQPLVLCHNDLHGRNILMKATTIIGVIDWEFAGSFPLNELDVHGIEVLEMVDEASVEECFKLGQQIGNLVEEVARERGWTEKDVRFMIGEGDRVLQAARVEMFPE